jgi:hypothetical protein
LLIAWRCRVQRGITSEHVYLLQRRQQTHRQRQIGDRTGRQPVERFQMGTRGLRAVCKQDVNQQRSQLTRWRWLRSHNASVDTAKHHFRSTPANPRPPNYQLPHSDVYKQAYNSLGNHHDPMQRPLSNCKACYRTSFFEPSSPLPESMRAAERGRRSQTHMSSTLP